MPTSVTMPALGESVTEGTVTRWLKQEGDQVEVDEPLLEVSTDKVDTEIPSPVAGVLTKIVVAEDETVEVGAELAVIGGEDGGDADAPAEDAPAQEAPAEEPAAAEEPAQDEPAEEAPAEQPAPAAAEQDGDSGGSDGEGTSVTMPALGESVTEGTVTRWLKQEGDQVEVDEPLLEVSTDKVDTEIPSPVAGVLTKIVVAEDETVEVGAELAVIGGSGGGSGKAESAPESEPKAEPAAEEKPAPKEEPKEKAAPKASQPTPVEANTDTGQPGADYGSSGSMPTESPTDQPSPAEAVAPASRPAAAPAPDGGGAYVTPLVRRLAAEHGVDLGSVTGTGVGGRIRKQDVLAAAEESKKEPAAAPAAAASGGARTPSPAATPDSSLRGNTEKLSRLRTVIAKRMVESLQISAQLTTVVEADVTRIANLRNQVKNDFAAREGVKLSFLPFFAKAAVEALKSHPVVNSSVDLEAGTVTYHDAENLGVAVDTERGLLVPVIRGAGDLNVPGIARKIADLAERTRTNKITPDELGGGTFTLTNTGSRGALFDTPIINQPQVAILGVGSVVKRPVVVQDPELGEVIAVRSMVYLALSYDHRIVDGADAARFLTTVKERLEGGQFQGDLGIS
ncbi:MULTISPECIES: 2-oxoglutarate dehydrogenase, E2 component, dihydrolipoamide succinyltransferase [unclassified Modestobacter]|uniref:2-oxoglutarate dehydrogenase, E2 component, dihydrolipoamide succinyltransferase n=1 Tax=unclassified Modestobacter TaxID=2643866 RepID=UPI0022AA8027|nr:MULTISPECIES: 2-oxoglutarate dehydrogenase, E2 component, dihydrolipoamide succinyltransferase [unclassified Modestobacter]MCZ2824740.1 2-oxoglutarate dehydrogenase, E2 component, dihydrolipoamide succinyltransferase [Modestobacter sp. VKM Ac-2981]MCZ2854757.1 2-oxoglutarate dehydrogenase, E2 component, dihydrolipoamide succinyltransferase [Modestobacter sp. VKM Ac-2982]